jgi:hypothetical protein
MIHRKLIRRETDVGGLPESLASWRVLRARRIEKKKIRAGASSAVGVSA